MELSIRRVAKQSSVTGESFEPGDIVESFLFRNTEGDLERSDLRPEESATFTVPENLLCRWRHRVRELDESDAAARRQSLASAEEMFNSLLEGMPKDTGVEGAVAARSREQLVLLNLLVLVLERRRVLKAVGGGAGNFWHVREKRPVRVPRVELDPAEIAPLLVELDGLL